MNLNEIKDVEKVYEEIRDLDLKALQKSREIGKIKELYFEVSDERLALITECISIVNAKDKKFSEFKKYTDEKINTEQGLLNDIKIRVFLALTLGKLLLLMKYEPQQAYSYFNKVHGLIKTAESQNNQNKLDKQIYTYSQEAHQHQAHIIFDNCDDNSVEDNFKVAVNDEKRSKIVWHLLQAEGGNNSVINKNDLNKFIKMLVLKDIGILENLNSTSIIEDIKKKLEDIKYFNYQNPTDMTESTANITLYLLNILKDTVTKLKTLEKKQEIQEAKEELQQSIKSPILFSSAHKESKVDVSINPNIESKTEDTALTNITEPPIKLNL